MEALADFGAVNLLNYRALTDAIYRVWYGAFDQAAALQLATVLVSLSLALVALEQLTRGRRRYHQALARGDAVTPRRLRGPVGWLAAAVPLLLLAAVFAGPIAQLVVWAVRSLGEGASAEALARAAVNSLLLASVAAVVAVVAATVVAYGPRARAVAGGRCGGADERDRLRGARHRRRGRRVRAAGLGRPPHRRPHGRRAAADRQRRRARVRLRGPLPRAGLLRHPVAHGADRPVARRGGAQPRRRPLAAAGRRAPAAAVAGHRHRRSAGVRRGDEGAARHGPAAAARGRHAGDRRVGGDQGLALRGGGAAGAADRRRRARPGGAGDPALAGRAATPGRSAVEADRTGVDSPETAA